MSRVIQTPKEYYSDKSMGIRYWIGGFLVVIILVQLTLPWWKDIGKSSGGKSIENIEQKQQPKTLLFDTEFLLTDEYSVYHNNLSYQQRIISDDEREQFSGYIHSKFFNTIREILEQEKIPNDFVYIPRILTKGDGKFLDKNGKAGIWKLGTDFAKRYELQVNDMIDQRFSVSSSTYAMVQYLKEMYYLYGDWNMVAITTLSDNPMDVRREYILLSQYHGDNVEYKKFIFNDIMINQSFPEQEDWNTYRDLPLENPKIFELLYRKTYIQNPTYIIKDKIIEYNTKKIKGPVNLVKWCKKNNVSYAILKQLNPRIRGTQLPDGKWNVTFVR